MTGTLLIATALSMFSPTDDADPKLEAVRAAMERGLPTIVKSMATYQERRDCFSCHHQAVPLVALMTAKDRGFDIAPNTITESIKFTETDLLNALELYKKGDGQPGGVTRAGYALLSFELAGRQADNVTDAVVDYLLKYSKASDHWQGTGKRPPSEGSDFTATYLAVRGLTAFGKNEQKSQVANRVEKVRKWLEIAKPKDTEDRVFRLLALGKVSGSPLSIRQAAKELLTSQHDDGGWSQLDDGKSDPYATATVLVALHLAGGLGTDSPEYRHGLRYLIANQRKDGTWYVASRSRPFQTYFESDFPYGKDQFISITATAWSLAALGFACPKP